MREDDIDDGNLNVVQPPSKQPRKKDTYDDDLGAAQTLNLYTSLVKAHENALEPTQSEVITNTEKRKIVRKPFPQPIPDALSSQLPPSFQPPPVVVAPPVSADSLQPPPPAPQLRPRNSRQKLVSSVSGARIRSKSSDAPPQESKTHLVVPTAKKQKKNR